MVATSASARDDVLELSVADAMANAKVSQAVGDGVQFYFGGQSHDTVKQTFGEWSTNKKTNAFGKSDEFACQWAFAGALKTLKQRAIKEGGNAVINIRSNYKNNLTSSDTHFKCGAGNVIAGVALIGDVVKL